jgi:hypothetical protein
MGCYLYDGDSYEKNKEKYTYINEYYNMDNFYYSYLLIFRCATGENWHNIMMEMAYRDDGKAEGYSLAFFIICNFITGIILSNLLLMITLQQYDEFRDKKYNPIEKFNSFLSDFNNAWNKFSTEEDEGFRIKKTLVAPFFMELNWRKLNFPEKGKLEYIKKYVKELELYYDYEDYVYYHDVVFKLIYKQMGMQIDRNNPENNLIFKTEKMIQRKIKNITNKYIHKKKGKITKLISFNPLTAHLYYKLTFLYLKTFINKYRENSELLQHSGDSIDSIIEDDDNNESIENSEYSNSKSDENLSDNNDSISNIQKSLIKKENSISISSNKDSSIHQISNNLNNEKSKNQKKIYVEGKKEKIINSGNKENIEEP